jgi:hypothetical protein
MSDDMKALEQNVERARERFLAARKALAPKHKGGEMEAFRAAHEALIAAERELAAARKDEHAVPLDFPVQWDIGAPLPQLVVNDYRTFLIFLVREPDPTWDGTYVTIMDPAAGHAEPLALVEFKHCASAKLGGPNDEVFHGHPLSGKGLRGYSAQIVRNSRWIAELQAINSVHSQYDPDRWTKLNHYVFWFHDSTFECVAESFTVELHRTSFANLLDVACKRLLGR